MVEKAGFVYIMASGKNGTIYIGVTSDLPAGSGNTATIWSKASPKNTSVTRSSGIRLTTRSKQHGSANCR